MKNKLKNIPVVFAFIMVLYILPIFTVTVSANSSLSDTGEITLEAPLITIYSNRKDTLKIEWEKIVDADYYLIYRGEEKDEKYKHIASVTDNVFYDKVLKTDTAYYYFIRACNNAENGKTLVKSPQSGVKSGAVVILGVPEINIGITENIKISTEWKKTGNADYYEIYRQNGEGVFILIGETEALSFEDKTRLNKNAVYLYKVRAVKEVGGKKYYGDFSRSVYIKTPSDYQAELPDNEWAYFLINKENYLPENYVPALAYINDTAMIDARCVRYARDMLLAAEKDGLDLAIISAYRSVDRQRENLDNFIKEFIISDNYSKEEAYAAATREIAPPGASEHNAGLALDIVPSDNLFVSQNFDQTSEYKWLAENAPKFGFILRYMKGKESVTGFIYEPWHFQFVGVKRAQDITESGLCLEEYMEKYYE